MCILMLNIGNKKFFPLKFFVFDVSVFKIKNFFFTDFPVKYINLKKYSGYNGTVNTGNRYFSHDLSNLRSVKFRVHNQHTATQRTNEAQFL